MHCLPAHRGEEGDERNHRRSAIGGVRRSGEPATRAVRPFSPGVSRERGRAGLPARAGSRFRSAVRSAAGGPARSIGQARRRINAGARGASPARACRARRRGDLRPRHAPRFRTQARRAAYRADEERGPLDLVAADYYGAEAGRPAGVRSFARLDGERFSSLSEVPPSFEAMAGEGVVAITIEPRQGDQRYQGIVSLAPQSIAATAEAYFAQSEQLPTAIRLAAAPVYVPGKAGSHWLAGGLMLQATPEGRVDAHDWERLAAFLATVGGHGVGRCLAGGRDASMALVP